MAAELGLLSLTQLQKLAQSQQQKLNPSSFTRSSMWNRKHTVTAAQEDDDSWEERAFAEDTGNIMGTTWPPRSYTCTFCRREFRSAQALGGHMNVHRRDRAQLHQTPPAGTSNNPTSSSPASSSLIIPAQELVANSGLCFLYSLPNPNGIFPPTACTDSTSTLLSISPYPPNNLMSPHPPSINFPVAPLSIDSTVCHSSNRNEPSPSTDNNKNHNNSIKKESLVIEELDLELRLGCSSSPS